MAQSAEFKAYLDQQYADPNSYVPMDKARGFMDSWLMQAKKFRARDHDGVEVTPDAATTPLRRLQAALPYLVVLAVGVFLYFQADNFEFEQASGRIGPGAWPKIILVMMLATAFWGVVSSALRAGPTRPRR